LAHRQHGLRSCWSGEKTLCKTGFGAGDHGDDDKFLKAKKGRSTVAASGQNYMGRVILVSDLMDTSGLVEQEKIVGVDNDDLFRPFIYGIRGFSTVWVNVVGT
jgi:hypothetical protein